MRPGVMGGQHMGGAKAKHVSTPFSDEELKSIDDVRFGLRHVSRTETMRFLVKKGLQAVAGEQRPVT